MSAADSLKRLANRALPAPAARLAKRIAVHPRYQAQARACRRGFREHGSRYPQKVLFVAGLPKSGTTWLEKMLSSYPGFHELLIPDVAAHEMATGGSHDYELPDDIFSRFDRMLVLTKMHVHGSPHNIRVLHDAGVNYVVLFRDLRDVAVSHHFYVSRTPWHPEYPLYRRRSVEEGLRVFADRLLEPFADWVRSWRENRDPDRSVVFRYEEMLDDAHGALKRMAALFQLPDSPEEIRRIAESHSFQRMSGGRSRGQEQSGSFVRKGVAGDWVNHFTPEIRDLYKGKIGSFLIEMDYEQDDNW